MIAPKSTVERVEFLIKRLGFAKACQACRCSKEKMIALRSGDQTHDTQGTKDRVSRAFRDEWNNHVAEEDAKKLRAQPQLIKNYDDDDTLEDFKGGYRKGGAGGGSNNYRPW